ncbi:hypothetical protein [Dapis sp. BLCC M126]
MATAISCSLAIFMTSSNILSLLVVGVLTKSEVTSQKPEAWLKSEVILD